MTRATEKIPTKPTHLASQIHKPVIKVLGLGGGGGNAVDRMIDLGIRGVDFVVANTDQQALNRSKAPVKIHLGPKSARGLGAGGNPALGRTAAEESWREIARALAGADMVFLTAGMGGGTGTGSISIAAQIAKAQKAIAIAVVTTPFSFEMGRRQKNAAEGLINLRKHANTLISIPNDRLLEIAPRDLPLDTAFRLADDVLRQAVQSITELITEPGLINVDFAHIRRLMKLGGGALMTIGQASGQNKALTAIQQALYHPLLDNISIRNAAGIIANFTAGADLTLMDINSALSYLQEQANPLAEIVMGTTVDNRMEDRVQVILVVTGLGASPLEEVLLGAEEKISRPLKLPESPSTESPEEIRVPQMVATSNLDIPAFMRRQPRYAGQ
jgi:cell division protein FtsZ